MAGYIDGKVEIFCGNYPPSNENIFWYKRFVNSGLNYYLLLEFNNVTQEWQPINSSLVTNGLLSEDEILLYGEDNKILSSEF